jgi:hypothetical protein
MSLKKHIRMARRNRIITPRLHGWLANNNGIKIEDESIRQRVIEILSPSDGDRSGSFHPSQLYKCPRAQVFEYLGAPSAKSYNPVLQNLFNDGHFRHLRWQVMLLSAGILTDVEVPVALEKYRLTGSMDGMNRNDGWMFELKGTSQYKAVQQKGAMPAHVKQVNAYLMASGLERAVIVYECKSSQDWTEIEVEKDPVIISELEEILESLNDAIETGTLPEVKDACKNQEGSEYNSCAYSDICFRFSRIEQVTTSISLRGRDTTSERDA